MELIRVVVFAVVSLSVVSGCDVNALPPKNDPPIDMSQFKGVWYETVTSVDRISMDHSCIIIENVTITPTGHNMFVTYVYDNAPDISIEPHSLNMKDGYFRQAYIGNKQDEAQEIDNDGFFDPTENVESEDMKLKIYSNIGVPDHYFSYVRCTPKGWTIWAFTKEKTVNPELLLYIRNDLLKRGISIPLRLGRCGAAVHK